MRRLLGLYRYPEEKESPVRDFLRSIVKLIGNLQERFLFFVGLSLSIHVLVFALLSVQAHSRASVPEARAQSNDRAISRAVTEMAVRRRLKMPSGRGLTPEKMEAMVRNLDGLFRFDPTLTEREKTEIFQELMEVSSQLGGTEDSADVPDPRKMAGLVELLKQKKGLRLSSGNSVVIAQAAPDGRYEVSRLDESASRTLERLEKEAAQGKARTPSPDGMVEVPMTVGPKSVPEEYFFRKCPYQEMIALGPRLFTVFRGFPDLTAKPDESGVKDRADAPSAKVPGAPAGPVFVYLIPTRPPAGAKEARAVLTLSEADRERILDELMALRETEQPDAFRSQYLDRYDADQEDLAKLTREFLFSNMNNVFFVADRFSCAFDFLEEIYYKRENCDLFASYARRFPKSRTGTEIMFYLASFYEFERRALDDLFRSQRDAKAIISGDAEGPVIYQPTMKAFVVRRVYQDIYRLARDLDAPLESLPDQYLRRQEEIYSTLIGFGGEVRNRALFAWGRLLWDEAKFEEAVKKWRQVDPIYPLSSKAYWNSIGYIDRYGLENSVRYVDEKLSAESLSDQLTVLEKHVKFHTWKKRTE